MYFNNFLCVNYKKIIALEGILVSFPNGHFFSHLTPFASNLS